MLANKTTENTQLRTDNLKDIIEEKQDVEDQYNSPDVLRVENDDLKQRLRQLLDEIEGYRGDIIHNLAYWIQNPEKINEFPTIKKLFKEALTSQSLQRAISSPVKQMFDSAGKSPIEKELPHIEEESFQGNKMEMSEETLRKTGQHDHMTDPTIVDRNTLIRENEELRKTLQNIKEAGRNNLMDWVMDSMMVEDKDEFYKRREELRVAVDEFNKKYSDKQHYSTNQMNVPGESSHLMVGHESSHV